jgi:predicted protein tyrosine phosphatase
MKIIVSSLALAPGLIASERPSHVVSLLSPEEIHLAPNGHAADRHLRLGMHDLREATALLGDVPPQAEHVDQLIAFGRGWSCEAPILVHCWAGISRSTAAAFTLACARNPETDEAEIALALRAASPTAWPNPVLVGHADAALGRGGRMLAAIAAIGMPESFEGAQPFHLPGDFPGKGSW